MKLNQKRFNTLRRGRINTRAESRKQLVLRNNLEKRFYKNLTTLFRKFLNVQLFLYKEFGIYENDIAIQSLNEDFMPLMLNQYRRTFQVMYKSNEENYYDSQKADEAFVFGRSTDFERVVNEYFNSRQLILAGITTYISAYITLNVFGQSIIGAFVVGYILDIIIDKYNIFGDSLKPYYKTAGSGLWGGIAIMFAMIISLFIIKNIK